MAALEGLAAFVMKEELQRQRRKHCHNSSQNFSKVGEKKQVFVRKNYLIIACNGLILLSRAREKKRKLKIAFGKPAATKCGTADCVSALGSVACFGSFELFGSPGAGLPSSTPGFKTLTSLLFPNRKIAFQEPTGLALLPLLFSQH